jgi:hypothetical protein
MEMICGVVSYQDRARVMSNFQQRIATELSRRTKLLPDEIEEWNKQSDANNYGMGIHQSQVRAVTRLFEGMLNKQNALMGELDPAKGQEEFTQKRQDVEQSLTGTHSIMSTFRYIFSQRDDTQSYKKILDAADLVAAYSYLPCIKLANKWNDKSDEHYREPPLIYLNAKLSPAAITRRHFFGKIGLELQGEEELLLPISVISLSFHDTAAFWTLCSIYHEVGHVLDQDLGLRAKLGEKLIEKLNASTKENWGKTWLGEIVADAFGVLLGGSGYAYALMNMLFKTKGEVVEGELGAHPNSYVRMFLVSALLHRTGIDSLKTTAEAISTEWKALYDEPAIWKSYVEECTTVAEVLLEEPLAKLNGRCLLDFARNNAEFQNAADIQNDNQRAKALRQYLLTGIEDNDFIIAMTNQESLIRLVPAAAQLAVQEITSEHEDTFELIHTNALEFLLKLEHKEFLADSVSDEHDAYVNDIIDRLNFSSLNIEVT